MSAEIVWKEVDETRLSQENWPAKGDSARFSKNHPRQNGDDLQRKIDDIAPAAYKATVKALRHNKQEN